MGGHEPLGTLLSYPADHKGALVGLFTENMGCPSNPIYRKLAWLSGLWVGAAGSIGLSGEGVIKGKKIEDS